MAFDEETDWRVGALVADWTTDRRRMFGGTCYLLEGNMMCGVLGEAVILRLGAAAAVAALEEDGVRPFDVTGRPMKGWVMLDAGRVDDAALRQWLGRAYGFARSLPSK